MKNLSSLNIKINRFLKLASLSLEDKLKEARRRLGVDDNATFEMIKKRFQHLAFQNHPDKGGSSDLLRSVIDAYKLLERNVPKDDSLEKVITVMVSQPDGNKFDKSFDNSIGVRDYISQYVGNPPADFSSGYDFNGNKTRNPYAVSADGEYVVRLKGISWKELYPNESFWMSPKEEEEYLNLSEISRERYKRLVYENPGMFADEIADWMDKEEEIAKNRLPKSHRLNAYEPTEEEIKQNEIKELAKTCPYKGDKEVCDKPGCEHGWIPF